MSGAKNSNANKEYFDYGNVKNRCGKDTKETVGKRTKKKCRIANELGNKTKKEPLPMKLRALPESFWQQPNKMLLMSPGAEYSICPDLEKDENVFNLGNRHNCEQISQNGTIMTDANTDLLFSLFKKVEDQVTENSKPRVSKRGRPKKSKTYCENVSRDDDPYLANSIVESLSRVLPPKSNPDSLQSKIAASEQVKQIRGPGIFVCSSQKRQVLAMVSNETNASAMTTKDNYSQILSDLVVKL